MRTDGYAKVYTGSEHDLTRNLTVGNTWGVDTEGVRHYAHWAETNSDDGKWRNRLKVDHSTDGQKSLFGSTSMRDSGDRDHTLNVRVDADETGISGKELEYVHENPEGFGASVAVGESGDKFYGRVGVTKETEDGDQQYFGVGVNEDGEVEAEGRITHNVSDDVDVHAGVRKSRSGGATVSAGLNADVGEDKDFDLNMGITANTKGDKFGANVGLRRRATAERTGVGARAGFSTDKKKTALSFGGDLSTKNLFGMDDLGGKIGLDTGIERFKKVEVKPRRGEIGRLREAALEEAPEGAKFVRYGLKTKAKANLGVKVPVGAAFVEAGFKGTRLPG